ncbi:hypothetical protein EON76_00025 [bacterium]|nr:MAG: hypothetical protein EON76_00025 [bacterium]
MTPPLLGDILLPTLIMIRGIPGGGKSYLATAIQQILGNDNVVIIDPDTTDYSSTEYAEFSRSLSRDGVELTFHPYRFNRARAHQAVLDQKVVIWNQAFMSFDGLDKTVTNLQTFADEHSLPLPILIAEVEIEQHIAQQRIADRAAHGGHNVTDDKLTRFVGTYHSFSGQGYETVTINGADEITESATNVLHRLTKR